VKNYLEFETTDRYDLIIMIMCDFCALSQEQSKVMLSKFHELLNNDGCILLDVYSLSSFNKKEETAIYELNQLNGFWSPNDYYAFVNSFKYEKEKVSLNKYTIVEENRKRVVYNWLQYYSKETLITQFEENGFKIAEFYSDVAGKPFDAESNEMAVVAKKAKLY
jgi:hypothetical protein